MYILVRGYSAPGRYPATEYQARHLFRCRHENGLAKAFARAGSRILIDPERIDELLREQGAEATVANWQQMGGSPRTPGGDTP